MKYPLLSHGVLALLFGAVAAFTSCQDAATEVGSSLVSDRVTLVVDSDFVVTGQSVLNPRIQSRTTTQLLGSIRAAGYGTLSGNYVVQMMPSVRLSSNITRENIDSVKLLLVFDRGGFVGDSLAPMGVRVFPLDKPLAENDTIFSDFGSRIAEYVDLSRPIADGNYTAAYTAAGIGISDTVASSSYRYVYVPLPRQEALRIYDAYQTDSIVFNNPDEFTQTVFPGYYVKSSFGSGRVTRITDTRWCLFYHNTVTIEEKDGTTRDSIVPYYGVYMASAPEVISGSCIELTMDSSIDDMARQGKAVMLSPAGRDVQIRFPLPELIKRYRAQAGDVSVINSLNFTLPAAEISNPLGISCPSYVLMVRSSEKDKFFAQNSLPDNVVSFYGTYSSSTATYYFSDMRSFMSDMLEKYADTDPDLIPVEEYTFTLTPISIVSESSNSYYTTTSYMSSVSPLVALPAMSELLLDKAKIKLSFSKQN